MARSTAPDKTFQILAGNLGDCDNHPGVSAVAMTDGGGKHSVIKYCEACWRRYEGTRPTVSGGLR